MKGTEHVIFEMKSKSPLVIILAKTRYLTRRSPKLKKISRNSIEGRGRAVHWWSWYQVVGGGGPARPSEVRVRHHSRRWPASEKERENLGVKGLRRRERTQGLRACRGRRWVVVVVVVAVCYEVGGGGGSLAGGGCLAGGGW